jgi:UDP-N-acetylmuramate--alanine ligase
VVTYGFARQAEYRAANLRQEGMISHFDLIRRDELLGQIALGMPGRHNVSNALAAAATSIELSIPFGSVKQALDGFSGVQRRFTVVGEVGGVTVIDDYGHHPVEIVATLEAADHAWPDRRVVAVFQPHRFSRVENLWDDFCGAFNRAAEVVVCPIYAAGEQPIVGIDHALLADAMRNRGHRATRSVDSLEAAATHLAQTVSPGDVVITLGAGNVNQVCQGLVERLGEDGG